MTAFPRARSTGATFRGGQRTALRVSWHERASSRSRTRVRPRWPQRGVVGMEPPPRGANACQRPSYAYAPPAGTGAARRLVSPAAPPQRPAGSTTPGRRPLPGVPELTWRLSLGSSAPPDPSAVCSVSVVPSPLGRGRCEKSPKPFQVSARCSTRARPERARRTPTHLPSSRTAEPIRDPAAQTSRPPSRPGAQPDQVGSAPRPLFPLIPAHAGTRIIWLTIDPYFQTTLNAPMSRFTIWVPAFAGMSGWRSASLELERSGSRRRLGRRSMRTSAGQMSSAAARPCGWVPALRSAAAGMTGAGGASASLAQPGVRRGQQAVAPSDRDPGVPTPSAQPSRAGRVKSLPSGSSRRPRSGVSSTRSAP